MMTMSVKSTDWLSSMTEEDKTKLHVQVGVLVSKFDSLKEAVDKAVCKINTISDKLIETDLSSIKKDDCEDHRVHIHSKLDSIAKSMKKTAEHPSLQALITHRQDTFWETAKKRLGVLIAVISILSMLGLGGAVYKVASLTVQVNEGLTKLSKQVRSNQSIKKVTGP